ncbi:exodeoxyribonuclease VII small subunit [Collinsella sp. zg1085]|uniref:exodeoxyribonuclease VII small subunit n=1 Tax=Collinsella sp. zg1085 TaxID=2844380 RepID=UPI001C0BCEF3|nr:exodeoxyribonuclease VII small subunit [Collinsella sp. zg1085]QWT18002.1 exodeoxyribonuclease VII small subunit [Collinsella sp. zg1085]
MSEQSPVEELSYKAASQELERIIRNLESGELELEDSLTSYTRGIELLKSLRSRLASAEQHVSILMKDAEGQETLVPTDAADTSDELSL